MRTNSQTQTPASTFYSDVWPMYNGPYYWAEMSSTFEVEGFGSNPGKKFVDATPGEYKKLHILHPKGHRKYGYYWPADNFVIQEYYDGIVTNSGVAVHYPYQYMPLSYDSQVYNNALSDLWENVRKTDINLALTIGEGRETARMFPRGSIYKLLTTARRAKREWLMNPSKKLSEVWLSYKYGWGPCLQDVYNYLKWTYDLPERGIPVRGRSRTVWKENKPVYDYGDPTPHCTLKGEQGRLCEVKIWLDVGNNSLYNTNRITSLNPLSIAWELVPLSFVADWFIDVGGYLQNMEAALGAGLSFKRGYVSEVCWANGSCRYDWDSVTPWGYYYYNQYTSASYQVWKRRIKLSGFPFPRAPRLNARLGWQRILSTAALLRVILLGKVK